jgi:glycosyltransferase involved in cell wall biosynthesis
VIRYAVLTPSLAQPGGAERHIYALIAHADPARLRCVSVVVGGAGGTDVALCRAIRGRGVEIVGDPPAAGKHRVPGLVSTYYRTLRGAIVAGCAAADVLITWGSLAMGRFTDGLGIPAVCVSHCAEPATPAGTTVDGITHLVAVSRAATRFWGDVPNDLPVDVIPNGVEVERCIPRVGRDRQRVVGYVGRHHPIKRPEACIRALTALPDDHVAVLVGGRPDVPARPAPYLVALADELGVSARVRFEPSRVEMGDAYAAMDCLMLASVREADSLTLKEAMICGLPVCATAVGAIPEMEEEFGSPPASIVADAESPAHLAAAVARALSRAGIEDADRVRRTAWDRWTAQAMATRWADYLERICR